MHLGKPHLARLLRPLALAALLCLVAVPNASARSLQEQEKSVISLLSAYEYVPSRTVLDRILLQPALAVAGPTQPFWPAAAHDLSRTLGGGEDAGRPAASRQ